MSHLRWISLSRDDCHQCIQYCSSKTNCKDKLVEDSLAVLAPVSSLSRNLTQDRKTAHCFGAFPHPCLHPHSRGQYPLPGWSSPGSPSGPLLAAASLEASGNLLELWPSLSLWKTLWGVRAEEQGSIQEGGRPGGRDGEMEIRENKGINFFTPRDPPTCPSFPQTAFSPHPRLCLYSHINRKSPKQTFLMQANRVQRDGWSPFPSFLDHSHGFCLLITTILPWPGNPFQTVTKNPPWQLGTVPFHSCWNWVATGKPQSISGWQRR